MESRHLELRQEDKCEARTERPLFGWRGVDLLGSTPRGSPSPFSLESGQTSGFPHALSCSPPGIPLSPAPRVWDDNKGVT